MELSPNFIFRLSLFSSKSPIKMSNRTDSGQKNITGLCRIECLALVPNANYMEESKDHQYAKQEE